MTHPQKYLKKPPENELLQTNVRLSVGIEDVNDLLEDLKQGLDKASISNL